jgi:hypothetical protein
MPKKKPQKPISLDQMLKEGRIQNSPEITDWMKKLQTDPDLIAEHNAVKASADRAMKEMLGELLEELESHLTNLTDCIALIRTYYLRCPENSPTSGRPNKPPTPPSNPPSKPPRASAKRKSTKTPSTPSQPPRPTSKPGSPKTAHPTIPPKNSPSNGGTQ